MGRRKPIAAALALMSLAACNREAPEVPSPVDIAREHGTVAIVAQLDVPNVGTDGSPAYDPAAIHAAQEKLLTRLGSAHVTFRPDDVPNIGLRLDAREVKKLEGARVLAGYYIDKGREPNDPTYR